MPKQCQALGCTRDVFSHNYCKMHQSMRKDEKYLKSLLKQYKRGNAKIKPKSDKRMNQDIEYRRIKKEREAEMKAKGEWRCIFCGTGFYDTEIPDWHHLKGRDGDLMVDPEYLYPAHTCCHIRDFHQATVKHMKSMFWYEGFLERIKNIDINLYNKEMRKEDKS